MKNLSFHAFIVLSGISAVFHISIPNSYVGVLNVFRRRPRVIKLRQPASSSFSVTTIGHVFPLTAGCIQHRLVSLAVVPVQPGAHLLAVWFPAPKSISRNYLFYVGAVKSLNYSIYLSKKRLSIIVCFYNFTIFLCFNSLIFYLRYNSDTTIKLVWTSFVTFNNLSFNMIMLIPNISFLLAYRSKVTCSPSYKMQFEFIASSGWQTNRPFRLRVLDPYFVAAARSGDHEAGPQLSYC